MGAFSRRTDVPVHHKLRVSFWASAGITAVLVLLCLIQEVLTRTGARDAFREHWWGADEDAPPRRLISEIYPDDLVLTQPYYEDPNRWYLIILHCIAMMYMLIGLNTVCDVFFCGALDVMVDTWDVTPDVAGATFMAAGGSAPELVTSFIGVIVGSDVGFSTIVGSAVFNVLFVIGLCGYVAKTEVQLTWWPLFRDCSFYMLSLGVVLFVAYDQKVVLWESCLLFGGYLLYCTLMYNNSTLEKMVDSRVRKASKQIVPEEKTEVSNDPVIEIETGESIGKQDKLGKDIVEVGLPAEKTTTTTEVDPEPEPEQTEAPSFDKYAALKVRRPSKLSVISAQSKDSKDSGSNGSAEEQFEDFMKRPEGGGFGLISWYASVPIYFLLYCGIPEPTEKRYMFTFFISLLWISAFAFVLVWCGEIVADVVFSGSKSAAIIMGFTVLAAGTSIPDAVSSMAVARAGKADMAVSSSIGSNIFDILFGLPVPWTIKCLGVLPGNTYVSIQSDYIPFYVLLLLLMVFLTVTSIHCVGWKLNKTLGVCMAALYAVFLIIALLVEFVYQT